jgi:hypothetical protein
MMEMFRKAKRSGCYNAPQLPHGILIISYLQH